MKCSGLSGQKTVNNNVNILPDDVVWCGVWCGLAPWRAGTTKGPLNTSWRKLAGIFCIQQDGG